MAVQGLGERRRNPAEGRVWDWFDFRIVPSVAALGQEAAAPRGEGIWEFPGFGSCRKSCSALGVSRELGSP